MGDRSLLERAKRGEADAIAVLMNRSLQRQGITVQVQHQEGGLYLLLEAIQVPDRTAALIFVQQALTRLNLGAIDQITVFGRRQGEKRSTWRERLQLRSIPLMVDQPNGRQTALANAQLNYLPIPAEVKANRKQTCAAARNIDSKAPSDWVQGITQANWRSLAIGWVLAMLLLSSGILTFVFYPFITLVHELGHAFCGWLFGYPAIPAFDFVHGGGVTSHFGRLWFLIGGIYIGFGYVYYRYRNNYLTLRCLLGGVVVYSTIIFTSIHEAIITVMGHGFELLFSGVFLYRTLSGEACHYPIERPLYAMMAFFTLTYDIRFAYGLIFDLQARAGYLQGKGGLIHDLVILAGQYAGGNLSAIVAGFLGCCLLTPLITLVLYRYRVRLRCLVHRLFLVLDDSQSSHSPAPSR
ncbi:MAG: hypothetical protein MJA27_08155 [Pseudanabaenales cyanobacterium]|nr:hypothetical protein [Pseudanabaenales cyanobacterium]